MDSERYVAYSVLDLYPVWQEQAHCRGVGHEYYFGRENRDKQPTMSIKQVRNAAKLCDVCPVFIECLTHALSVREEYGVWAGTSGRTRRRMFTLMDKEGVTVESIIEAVMYDRGARGTVRAFPRHDQGGDRLRAEGAGEVAQ